MRATTTQTRRARAREKEKTRRGGRAQEGFERHSSCGSFRNMLLSFSLRGNSARALHSAARERACKRKMIQCLLPLNRLARPAATLRRELLSNSARSAHAAKPESRSSVPASSSDRAKCPSFSSHARTASFSLASQRAFERTVSSACCSGWTYAVVSLSAKKASTAAASASEEKLRWEEEARRSARHRRRRERVREERERGRTTRRRWPRSCRGASSPCTAARASARPAAGGPTRACARTGWRRGPASGMRAVSTASHSATSLNRLEKDDAGEEGDAREGRWASPAPTPSRPSSSPLSSAATAGPSCSSTRVWPPSGAAAKVRRRRGRAPRRTRPARRA